MNLHLDKKSFSDIIGLISQATGLRPDVLEKDYYVTLFLSELSYKQNQLGLQAYFKGGTALYKALKTNNRFSEDIDITVEIAGCNSNQAKKRLELATKKYESLVRTDNKSMEENKKGSITCVYDYMPVTVTGIKDPLSRFSHVKIEATSFTVSEPFENLQVAPMIFEYATEPQQKLLSQKYQVSSFKVKTITIERIFVDKIMAAQLCYQKKNYLDTAKHLYDLIILLPQNRITSLMSHENKFYSLVALKKKEEESWLGSDLDKKSFDDYTVFTEAESNKELKDAFSNMQDIYVFNDDDKLDYFDTCQVLFLKIYNYLVNKVKKDDDGNILPLETDLHI